MHNGVLVLTILIFLVLALFAGIWKNSNSNITPQLQESEVSSLTSTLMSSDKVLLASRTILLEDPPATSSRNLPLPTIVNLWQRKGALNIAVDDQGQYGSCTAHAMRYAWRLWKNRLNANQVPPLPSRTFWYAQSRIRIRENLKFDRGSTNQATVWVLANQGMVTEAVWPYSRENIYRAPFSAVVNSAGSEKCKIPISFRFFANPATTLNNLRTALAQGRSIIIAVLVYSSFMQSTTLRTGKIPLPNPRRERLLGGHAITLTGYDFNRAVFTFRNSWGTKVGMNGSFEIPFAYIANPSLTGDAWIF
jgi:C1A family cysteine protease